MESSNETLLVRKSDSADEYKLAHSSSEKRSDLSSSCCLGVQQVQWDPILPTTRDAEADGRLSQGSWDGFWPFWRHLICAVL